MSERLLCQVCGRTLVPLANGLHRDHRPAGGSAFTRCPGGGYRAARWLAGQQLRHHSGDVWIVVGDLPPAPHMTAHLPSDDYSMRCIAGREEGREMRAHAEYMHRHGWTPISPEGRVA